MTRPAESPPDGPESPDEDIDAPLPADEPRRRTGEFDDERRRGYEPL